MSEPEPSIAALEDKKPDERGLLLVQHRSGGPDSKGAFAKLVAAYRAPVFGYLVRCGVPDGDRDDLFQDIFIRVHRAAHQYQADRPLHPWLFTVVANTVRTYMRKRRVQSLFVSEGVGETDPKDPTPDHERAVTARQTLRTLEAEIAQLPLAQREVVVLSCIQHRPQKEVAEILQIPLNTVKTHLRRARLHLAERLSEATRTRSDEVMT